MEVKFCEDCKYHVPYDKVPKHTWFTRLFELSIGRRHPEYDKCCHYSASGDDGLVSRLSTGYASHNRNYYGKCGKDAKHFEPKEQNETP